VAKFFNNCIWHLFINTSSREDTQSNRIVLLAWVLLSLYDTLYY